VENDLLIVHLFHRYHVVSLNSVSLLRPLLFSLFQLFLTSLHARLTCFVLLAVDVVRGLVLVFGGKLFNLTALLCLIFLTGIGLAGIVQQAAAG
jgi:hypothetical protein